MEIEIKAYEQARYFGQYLGLMAETLVRTLGSVGPASQTVAQHNYNNGPAYRCYLGRPPGDYRIIN